MFCFYFVFISVTLQPDSVYVLQALHLVFKIFVLLMQDNTKEVAVLLMATTVS